MNNFSISFKYEFQSGLGPMDIDRYLREFFVGIYAGDENEPEKLIGRLKFKIVYINEGLDAGYDLLQLLDADEYALRHGFDLFDFEREEFKKSILKHYHYDLFNLNICLLERIEILPEYRGHNIAAKATKDIVFHFSAVCGLFIIQSYPLQFESKEREPDEWQKQLKLDNFNTNEPIAFKQLGNYYKSFGFEEIKGFENLLFYNPMCWNEKFDAIDLEE